MEGETIEGSGIRGEIFSIAENNEHIHHCAVSPDGKYVAAVFGNGVLRIMSAATLETVARVSPDGSHKDLPATCVRWFPPPRTEAEAASPSNSTAYKLVSVSTVGGVFGWGFDGSALERYAAAEEEANEITVVDVSPDGSRFITAGSDRMIRMYTAADFVCERQLTRGVDAHGNPRAAHVNRILSARHISSTAIASAGWEGPVQLWDTRTGRAFAQVQDTQSCSDCVEPIPGSAAYFFIASGNATQEAAPVVLARGSDGVVLREESERLCSHLRTSAQRVVVVRVDATNGHLWCLSLSPHAVTVVAISTGNIVASLPLPAAPMNLTLSPSCEDGTLSAFVSCHGSKIIRVRRE